MSNQPLNHIELLKLSVDLTDYLFKRIAELETENNRLRAETTRTIIPESSWIELKEDYAELEAEYNDLSKAYQELEKNRVPSATEYKKLDDRNQELQKEVRILTAAYNLLAKEYADLKHGEIKP